MRLFVTLLWLSVALTGHAENEVTARLTANRSEIEVGQPFLVGIHLKMSDHWHTYWENPGFAGQAPSWNLEAVPGLELGALQFPWPKRWVDSEGFVSFGYDDEVLVYATATYRGDASEIHLKGDINWVACKEICIPGKATADLKLKVGTAQAAEAQLFQQAQATTPKPYTDALPFTYDAEVVYQPEQWDITLTLHLKDGVDLSADAIQLFPLGTREMAELKTQEVETAGRDLIYRLTYEAWEENVPTDFVPGAALQIHLGGKTYYTRLPFKPQTTSTAAAPAGTADTPTAQAAETPATPGLFLYYLFAAFIGGLILNLMPCVLPVLSLKVFSLLQEAGESKGRRLMHGWIYTLGILVSFNIISGFFIAAKAAGAQLGVGFQFQNPVFVVAMCVLIMVMGLSFLGVFHLEQPTSNKLHNLSMRGGYQGSFFNGALMTLLSTPCTAPMLGAAYGWALSQSSLVILLIFNAIALGLAFPYLVLCRFPALLKFLPKPGAWMEQFKVAMGFMMMGTLVWLFMILSDLTGTSGVTGTLAFLLFVSAAAYVFGRTRHSENWVKGLAAMLVLLVLGGYVGLVKLFDIRNPKAAYHEKMEELRLKFLSESGNADVGKLLEGQVTTAEKIQWVPYTPENLEHFRKQNRLIFVDYTASWCATCKLNERTVIDTRTIRGLFAEHEVVVMRADYTDKSDALTLDLKKFNRAGVPMYLVYPGDAEPILLPEIITRDLVADAVDEARTTLAQQASMQR